MICYPKKMEDVQPMLRKPSISLEGHRLFLRRSNGSARFLTGFESLMYNWFGFWPRDYWTHKDRKGYKDKG